MKEQKAEKVKTISLKFDGDLSFLNSPTSEGGVVFEEKKDQSQHYTIKHKV